MTSPSSLCVAAPSTPPTFTPPCTRPAPIRPLPLQVRTLFIIMCFFCPCLLTYTTVLALMGLPEDKSCVHIEGEMERTLHKTEKHHPDIILNASPSDVGGQD